jgi:hypothetical protein
MEEAQAEILRLRKEVEEKNAELEEKNAELEEKNAELVATEEKETVIVNCWVSTFGTSS